MFSPTPPLAMPVASGLRRLDLPGASSFREVRESIRTLSRDGSLAESQPVLIDLRLMRFLPTSPESEALADELSSQDVLGAHRVALVVQQGAQFGMARMVCTLAELRAGHVRAFTDDRSAVEWLMSCT
jgi:hypothetical protein